jgi:RHS repeat-associated protein
MRSASLHVLSSHGAFGTPTSSVSRLHNGDSLGVTKAVHGTWVTGLSSEIASNSLVGAVVYPDSDDFYGTQSWGGAAYNRIEYTYNRQGEVLTMKDQNGTVHNYTYDNLGRKVADEVTLPEGNPAKIDTAVMKIEYHYDIHGRVSGIGEFDGASPANCVTWTGYEYNEAGQVVHEYQWDWSETSYNYDPAHGYRLTSIVYPSGSEVHYSYGATGTRDDLLNRVSAITDATDAAFASYEYLGLDTIVKETYDESGINLDYTGGSHAYSGLDRFGRVVDQIWKDAAAPTPNVLDRYTYTYNELGQVTARTNGTNSALDRSYEYDPAGQLTAAGSESFTPNAAGNLGGANSANRANQLTSCTYDQNGNMTFDGTYHYTYDAWNRLREVYADSEGQASTLVVSYLYDGLGRRGNRWDGSTCIEYFYVGQQLIQTSVYTSPRYEYGPVAAQYQYVNSLRGVDTIVMRNSGDDLYVGSSDQQLYYLNDANSNVTALVENGSVVERYDYSAFGAVTIYDDDWSETRTDPVSGKPLSLYANNILFAGREFDPATGQYYNRARWYDPAKRVFITRDPIAADANLYRYCGNNPVSRTDPSGLVSQEEPRADIPIPLGPGPGSPGWSKPWKPTPKRRIDRGTPLYPDQPGTPYNKYAPMAVDRDPLRIPRQKGHYRQYGRWWWSPGLWPTKRGIEAPWAPWAKKTGDAYVVQGPNGDWWLRVQDATGDHTYRWNPALKKGAGGWEEVQNPNQVPNNPFNPLAPQPAPAPPPPVPAPQPNPLTGYTAVPRSDTMTVGSLGAVQCVWYTLTIG